MSGRNQKKMLADPRKADALLFAARDYLDEIGWTALVGSVDRIQQTPGEPEFKFELVIKFTGGRKDPEDTEQPRASRL